MNMTEPQIEITVNGETREVAPGWTVADLVNQWELTPQRVAIEHNLLILARSLWPETRLQPGDRLEIVHFVGGG
ncbi:MAG TPA: sulfur carrier protein ThiS [Blastocatellia bacterium]|nr:sulfur carrier protein ThiS [Blastocatellia bacterium]